MSNWTEVHSWLKSNISTYTWTGNIFWFTTVQDRNMFTKQFNCLDNLSMESQN